MTDRKLAILGVTAVIMAGWALFQGRISQSYTADAIVISPLIEGLDIDAVQKIRITSEKGDKVVDLVRGNEGFAVAPKDHYPADVKKVNDLISGCLDIRVNSGERITADAVNHAELGVTPETARCQVVFLGAEDKPIVGLLLSETDAETGRAYVRLTTGNEVYGLEDAPWLPAGASDYLDMSLFALKSDEVVQVTVTDPNGVTYTLSKPEESGEIRLENMPAGQQFKESTYRTVFNTLNYFRFEDVMPASSKASLRYDWTYTAKTKDDVVYTVKTAEDGESRYVRVAAKYTGPDPALQTQVESEEKLKERETRFLADEKAVKFNRRHKDWVYQIPSYKAGDLMHRLEDLLEPIPAPAAEETTASEAAPSPEPAAKQE